MDKTGYNKYNMIDEFSYNCIAHLIQNSEIIWKLLKYPTRDAYRESDLTQGEKAELIYRGQDDSSLYHVFMDGGSPDVLTREDCILRIVPFAIYPENKVVGTLTMSFEVYCHYKINTLSNYKTRVDTITGEILKVFNGELLGGIGRLYFDRLASQSNRLSISGQLPFKGKQILMSNKVA